MKIAELDSIQDLPPYVGHVYSDNHDTPLHILVGRGHKKWGKHRRETFYVTRCNRLTGWITRNNGLAGRRLCARCGSRKDFETVLYERYEHDRKVRDEQRRKEVLDEAVRAAERNWSNVSEAVEEEIVSQAEAIVASDKVVIPIEKDDLVLIRKILRARGRQFERLGKPMYHQRDHEKRIQALLDDVLIY